MNYSKIRGVPEYSFDLSLGSAREAGYYSGSETGRTSSQLARDKFARFDIMDDFNGPGRPPYRGRRRKVRGPKANM